VGIGFKNAGFDVIWACDFDKYAVQTYQKNVGNHVVQADIKKLTHADIPTAEVWAFGFPCQDLSVAGNKRGFRFVCEECGEEFALDDTEYADGVKCPRCGGEKHKAASRSGMFFEIMRLLDETQLARPEDMPKILMAENVKGLKPYIPVLEQEFQKRGYEAHVQLFNSKYWDVPQSRERYYIVGVRQGQAFQFPEEQHEYVPKLSTALDDNVDEKYFIADEKAQTIIKQALEKLDTLGKVHATLTPDRENRRQNGPRSKPEEAEMFTLTAQDIHGVILQTDEETDDLVSAICDESGLLNPNGCGKTLRVGGGVADKETQLPTHTCRLHGVLADPSQAKREGKYRIYDNISPTIAARDYKEPRLVIVEREVTDNE
jgi:DNA (cytosine-5)-methyltransferase 1